ncbi:hypothetical protein PMI07_002372 [Rhizobium sp. CF080]|uniref:hypothetical protein n=1 Tax=Rhizobium sp. (strain CF080) TaxID=1144310 RepID=UPI0002716FC8|nr:hypothetical protein [Rhizobium sp. CF080]EUB95884.1 hypothetical protein PMI07_002372 [Rhizobium sp. CF080]
MKVRDGNWTLLSWDPMTGRTVWSHFNGDETVFRIEMPVDNIVKENEFTRNATSGNKFGDWVKIASIPANLAHSENLVRAQSEGDDAYLSRWLNSSDNRAWRSFEGRV